MVERMCIVTRQVLPPAQMIRFVAGPDLEVVPDLKNTLPGRGVWVSARKSMVRQAVEKKAFARGLKCAAKTSTDLPELVDQLMTRSALGALGFARKAGQCITGAGKVDGAIRTGQALAVFHATDGSADGYRKLLQAAHAAGQSGKGEIKIWQVFSSHEMNLALGASNVIHASLTRGGAAENCIQRVKRMAQYREMEQS